MIVESNSSWCLSEINFTLESPIAEAGVGDVELLSNCSCGDISAHETCKSIFQSLVSTRSLITQDEKQTNTINAQS